MFRGQTAALLFLRDLLDAFQACDALDAIEAVTAWRTQAPREQIGSAPGLHLLAMLERLERTAAFVPSQERRAALAREEQSS